MKTIVKYGMLSCLFLGLVAFVPDIPIISSFVGTYNFLICIVMAFCFFFGITAYVKDDLEDKAYKYTIGLSVGLGITLIVVLIFGIVGGYMKWQYASNDGKIIHFFDGFFDNLLRFGLPGVILAFWIPYFNSFKDEKIVNRKSQEDILDSGL